MKVHVNYSIWHHFDSYFFVNVFNKYPKCVFDNALSLLQIYVTHQEPSDMIKKLKLLD